MSATLLSFKGKHLSLHFVAPKSSPASHKSLLVTVHYEMYDGIPLLSKWVTIENNDLAHGSNISVGVTFGERLEVNWQWSKYGQNWLEVTNDEPHGNEVIWEELHGEEQKMRGSRQACVTSKYDREFTVKLAAGFVSFRTHVLAHASEGAERIGLARRQILRRLAPHTLENPIYFHITTSESRQFRKVCVELN